MNTPDILEAAADIIDERGWYNAQIHTGDHSGDERCAFLAITQACSEHGIGRFDWQHMQDAFIAFIGVPSLRAGYAWNDAQEDAFTVTNALRKCAQELR